MITSDFKSWDKGIFSVVGTIGAPTSTEPVHWFRRDQPGVNPDSIYGDTDITYTWNQHGFRSDEFVEDGRDSILVVGDSWTIGMGVPVEHSWPNLLRDKIDPNFKIYNLSMAAASNDYIVRALYKTIDILKPKAVFVLWPGFAGREVAFRKKLIPFKRMNGLGDERRDKDLFKEFQPLFLDPSYFMYQHIKNKEFAKSICDNHGVIFHDLALGDEKFIINNLNNDSINSDIEQTVNKIDAFNLEKNAIKCIGQEFKFPLARDNTHFGHKWNNYISTLYYAKYLQTLKSLKK